MASDDNDQDAEYALSKLLQMGTVKNYQQETNPKTLDEAFSLARAAETRFANLDIWEFLRSNPSTLGEDFFKARITEARFEIIVKENKEHIVEKKIDVILPLPLQGEFASPEVKGSLDADEDNGVDEVSSAIDSVFDIGESLVVFLKWVSISRSRPLLLMHNHSFSTLKSKGLAIQKILIRTLTGSAYSSSNSSVRIVASVAMTISAILKSFMPAQQQAALAAAAAALAVVVKVLLGVPESVPIPVTTDPVVMKPVQSMSSSVTPVRRYGNPTSGYESYMLVVHSELPNSTQRNVPKPLEKRGPHGPTVVRSHSETVYPRPIHQLSKITESAYHEYPLSQHKYPVCPAPELHQAIEPLPTLYLDVGAVGHNFLQGGNSASGMSSLQSTGDGMNSEASSGGSGDDGDGNDVSTSGGKCSDDGGGGSVVVSGLKR
ncbi:hypothetical protein Tco_0874669 [Tanacetum coccineum]|uniref:Uncharacterized protein n=1 Tax=Tanacetum coccineum TaxID=301880 RepID=A0ABQ5BQY0_9ASTR